MPTQYIPIFIFAVLAAAFPAVTLVIFKFIRPSPAAVGAKLRPYECGVEAEGDTRGRYSVRFYIVAILFVIFDVEAVFLYPWALVYDKIGMYALIEMMLFIAVLVVVYVYAWKKEAFEWD